MAAFFTELINSIFTPGPTPTLVAATNASFACLQIVLLALLVATYSIHFVILSVLCAGLWVAINWFVSELEAHKAQEQAEGKKLSEKAADGADTDTDTETVIDSGGTVTGSREVEVVDGRGTLRPRGSDAPKPAVGSSRSEVSTEDEWERVEGASENDK